MEDREDTLFLKLSAALRIFLQYELSEAEIMHASNLLQEYLLQYKAVSCLRSRITRRMLSGNSSALWRRPYETKSPLRCSPPLSDLKLWPGLRMLVLPQRMTQ